MEYKTRELCAQTLRARQVISGVVCCTVLISKFFSGNCCKLTGLKGNWEGALVGCREDEKSTATVFRDSSL